MKRTQIGTTVPAETRRQADWLIEYRGYNMSTLLVRAIETIYRQENTTMTTQTTDRQARIAAICDALDALRRGISEPTIVDEDGTPEYVPGAYLTDASYTGSRDVILAVSEGDFGPAFDVDEASEEELDEAAAWAADNWQWQQ